MNEVYKIIGGTYNDAVRKILTPMAEGTRGNLK